MTDRRTVEDRLREEYFELLPHVRRATERLEAEVRYCVLPTRDALNKYERLVITTRVKECESALDALRRRQQGGTFDRGRPTGYTLRALPDLAGVRVLAFPKRRLADVDREVCKRFRWKADPVLGFEEDDGRSPLSITVIVGGPIRFAARFRSCRC